MIAGPIIAAERHVIEELNKALADGASLLNRSLVEFLNILRFGLRIQRFSVRALHLLACAQHLIPILHRNRIRFKSQAHIIPDDYAEPQKFDQLLVLRGQIQLALGQGVICSRIIGCSLPHQQLAHGLYRRLFCIACHASQRIGKKTVCSRSRQQDYHMEMLVLNAASGIQLAGDIQMGAAQQQHIHHLIQQMTLMVIRQGIPGLACEFYIRGRNSAHPLHIVGSTGRKFEVRHDHAGTQDKICHAIGCSCRIFKGSERKNHIGDDGSASSAKERSHQVNMDDPLCQRSMQVDHKCVVLHRTVCSDNMLAEETIPDIVEYRRADIGMTVEPLLQVGI